MEIQLPSPRVKNILYRYKYFDNLDFRVVKKEQESSYLLKYFPKYYKEIIISDLKPSVTSKLKRVKRIHRFSLDSAKKKPRVILPLIFGNKQRDVQALPTLFRNMATKREYMSIMMEKIKLFPKIHRLTFLASYEELEWERNCINPSFVPVDLDRVHNYLSSMKNLKHLIIKSKSTSLMTKLNSFGGLLAYLKIFKVILNSDGTSQDDFQKMNEMHTFFKYITHLSFYSWFEDWDIKFAVQILLSCENLVVLSITFKQNVLKEKVYAPFFKCLQKFKRLETLKLTLNGLSCESLSRCLQEFSLPSSIKHIEFSLRYPNKIKDLLDPRLHQSLTENANLTQWKAITADLFEENEACIPFYNSWKELTNLETLSFRFVESSPTVICFLVPLLRNISSLTSFKLESYADDTPVDLSSILKVIEHLRATLNSLEIELGHPINFGFDNLKEFPNLSSLCIKKLEGDESIKWIPKIFKMISENHIQSVIDLSWSALPSDESFRIFLDTLRKSKKAKGLKARLKIPLDGNVTQELECLCQFIETSPKMEGVLLNLYMFFDDNLYEIVQRFRTQSVFDEINIEFDFGCGGRRYIRFERGGHMFDFSN